MKRAIVFGATGGIGQAIAKELAADGWSLYLHYSHNEDLAAQLSTQLSSEFPQQDFFSFQYDFLEPHNREEFFKNFFAVNALVFAQGITNYGFFSEQTDQTLDQLLQVNLTEPLKIIKHFESKLLKFEHSRIILFGSVYGHAGSAMETMYSTLKGALSSFANAYAKEVASANLTVNVIAPGAVATNMNSIFDEEELAAVKEEIPAGRFANPDDISYWVKTITDERSDYLTGQTIYIDGGWLV